jgi:hypothetical protein
MHTNRLSLGLKLNPQCQILRQTSRKEAHIHYNKNKADLVNSSKKVSYKIPEMRWNQWHERKQKKGIPRPESKKSSRWSQRGRSGGVAEDDLPRAHQMAVSRTYVSRKPREGRRANLIKEDWQERRKGP